MADRAATENGDLLDRTFRISMLLKALDGVVELIGGVLLIVLPAHLFHDTVARVTRSELSQDPHDWLATHVLHAGVSLEQSRGFGAVYLLTHGLAKVVLVAALLRGAQWAYPALFWFLNAFIAYQVYRFATQPSIGLALLTIFDVAIVWLVWREWRRHRVVSI